MCGEFVTDSTNTYSRHPHTKCDDAKNGRTYVRRRSISMARCLSTLDERNSTEPEHVPGQIIACRSGQRAQKLFHQPIARFVFATEFHALLRDKGGEQFIQHVHQFAVAVQLKRSKFFDGTHAVFFHIAGDDA
jgi:hypothetical protein